MPALLEAKGLHAAYGETKVLHGIDFAVEEGAPDGEAAGRGGDFREVLGPVPVVAAVERRLRAIDAVVSGLPVFRVVGDHVLLSFERASS